MDFLKGTAWEILKKKIKEEIFIEEDEKIKNLENRIEKLENELQKAIERADNNRIHCEKCGSVNIELKKIRENMSGYCLECTCKDCKWKFKRIKKFSD